MKSINKKEAASQQYLFVIIQLRKYLPIQLLIFPK